MRRKLSFTLMALVSVGCRRPDPVASSSPMVSSPAPGSEAAAVRPEPPPTPLPTTLEFPADAFAIALPAGEDAPWLEPSIPRPAREPLDGLGILASSGDHAIAGSEALFVLTSRAQGVRGSIPALAQVPPAWVGILDSGAIVAVPADAPQQLRRIDSPAEALTASTWPVVATLPGAQGWDASGMHIVAVVGTEVAVSRDGGDTFARSVPVARARSIPEVVVRHDGVVAVQVDTGSHMRVLLSSDDGATWERSAWQPASIWREGSWIQGYRDPTTGALAIDGRTWAAVTSTAWDLARDQGYGWLDLDFSTNLLNPGPPPTRFVSPADPPPPAVPARPLRSKRAVRSGRSELGGYGMGTLGGVQGGMRCKAGVRCLHGSIGAAPPFTAHQLGVFSDLRCKTDEHPCPRSQWSPPAVGVFDHRAPRSGLVMGRLPFACDEREVQSARGLGLVACHRGSATTIFAVEPDGVVHTEHVVEDAALALDLLMQAPDGTLVVPESPACERWARAWVRRPVAAGHDDAWYEVIVEGGRAWRPVGRGAAVVIADHDSGDWKLATLWLAQPGAAPRRILDRVAVPRSPSGLRVDDGRVSIHDEGWKVVCTDGGLAPVTLPDRHEVVDGAIYTRAVPYLRCSR